MFWTFVRWPWNSVCVLVAALSTWRHALVYSSSKQTTDLISGRPFFLIPHTGGKIPGQGTKVYYLWRLTYIELEKKCSKNSNSEEIIIPCRHQNVFWKLSICCCWFQSTLRASAAALSSSFLNPQITPYTLYQFVRTLIAIRTEAPTNRITLTSMTITFQVMQQTYKNLYEFWIHTRTSPTFRALHTQHSK